MCAHRKSSILIFRLVNRFRAICSTRFKERRMSSGSGTISSGEVPFKLRFAENQTARARIFLSDQGFRAPTVIFLHALMSAHDVGYCRIAAHLNRRGWNAALMHLPYHYSRVPRGHFNGALALTSNLPQNAETLRQAVTEVRQLMEYLRAERVS